MVRFESKCTLCVEQASQVGVSSLFDVTSLYHCATRNAVTYDVHDWKTTANTEAYYAGGMSGLRGADIMQEMFVPLLDDLDSAGYDFAPLDSHNWGVFDHLVVINSGYPAEYGTPPDGCTANEKDRIWSQGIPVTANGWLSSDGIYSVSSYLLVGAFNEGLCKGNPIEMGVISHEYMHGINANMIDLYDLDKAEDPIPIGGTGKFSIMSNLHGWYVVNRA
jgi:M6 family metalloprotease-like protein